MAKTILILAANPKNTSRLRLEEEVREIDEGLQRAQKRDEFILKQQWAARPKDVRRAVLDTKPSIVHFCGHGEGTNGIVFEDDAGNAKLVNVEALSGFFQLFANTIECVLLNACYSEVQAQAIANHIPYVIGMKTGIKDAIAIEFAVAFYDALGAGEAIDFAYKLACNAIQWTGIPENLIPELKTKINNRSLANNNSYVSIERDEQPINTILNIMVSGGRNISHQVIQLANLIGQKVILHGHILLNNGAKGVDKVSSEGALVICHAKDINPAIKIQVFRPRKDPSPSFDFGRLHIVGMTHEERRNVVIQKSDAIIVLGGGEGTKALVRQAQIMRKPIVPVGIGESTEIANQLWHEMQKRERGNFSRVQIEDEDLQRIAPYQDNFEQVADDAVIIAEKLAKNKLTVKMRSFQCPPNILPDLLISLQNWLLGEGFKYQQLSIEDHHFLVQIEKEGEWRKLVGMTSAINVIFWQVENTVNVEVGGGKWVENAVAGVIGTISLPVAFVTAGVGFFQQTRIVGQVYRHIGTFLSQHGYKQITDREIDETVIER